MGVPCWHRSAIISGIKYFSFDIWKYIKNNMDDIMFDICKGTSNN